MAKHPHRGKEMNPGSGLPQAIGGQTPRSPAEQRHAAARSAPAEMKRRGLVTGIDDELLDLLGAEISEPVMREMVRFWRASKLDSPTPLALLTLAEVIHLRVAVAALDN
jgi:hypothetical protein